MGYPGRDNINSYRNAKGEAGLNYALDTEFRPPVRSALSLGRSVLGFEVFQMEDSHLMLRAVSFLIKTGCITLKHFNTLE